MYYLYFHCKVSDQYLADTVAITKKTLDLLNKENIPYWMDYASLLCIIRGVCILFSYFCSFDLVLSLPARSLQIYLSTYLSIYLSICLSIYLYAFLSMNLTP